MSFYSRFIKVSYLSLYLFSLDLNAFAEASDLAVDATEEMVLEVKAKKRVLNLTPSSRTEMTQEEIQRLPMGGEASLSRLITTTTPGVTQGAFGQMFFRGNHGNVQYLIDGVQLPDSPSGTFGQIFSPRNIERMEVLTGGIPAEYGQRLGAVVNMTTKTGPEKPGGEVELNYGSYGTASPHLLYGGSNEPGDIHYYLGLGFMRTGRGLDTPQPQSIRNQIQGGDESIHNSGVSDNEFMKVDWQANNANRVTLTLFNAASQFQIPNFPQHFRPTDRLFQPGQRDHFGNVGEDGGPPFTYVPSHTDDFQMERNTYLQMVWKNTISKEAFFQIAPFYKYSQVRVSNDPLNDLATLRYNPYDLDNNSEHATESGSSPIEKSHPVSFAQNRHVNNLGVKGDFTYRLNDQHKLKSGFFMQYSRSDGWFLIQDDLVASPFTNGDPASGLFEGAYLQDEFTLAKPLVLTAGLRFDATQFAFSGLSPADYLFQPRIGLSYLVTENTKLHAFYGKLFQPVSLENIRFASTHSHSHDDGHSHDDAHSHDDDLDEHSHGESSTAPMDLKAEKDDYYEVGIAHQFLEKQGIAFNVYYKDSINVIDEHQLFRAPIAQAHNFARGYSYGAEVSVKGELTRQWSEYMNYTYSIAKGQEILGGLFGGGAPESTSYQMLDHVQVHTANAGITYSKDKFWWSGQTVFGSGLRTGRNNDIELPSHLTFDTTVGYDFGGSGWLSRFKVSADLLNLFNTIYPITIANGYNSSQYTAGRQLFLRFARAF